MKPMLVQAALLANLALSLALGYHLFTQPALPILSNGQKQTADFPNVSIDDVWNHIEAGSASLVDARSAELYGYGHLPEALSAPSDTEIPPQILSQLKAAPLVVVYCDGPNCHASSLLALQLAKLGVTKVQIMREGWEGWLDAGRPVVLGGV